MLYVPHANRALRSFNMYFNVRKPPLIERSRIGWNPVRWFFARPKEVPAASMTSPQHDASSLSQQNTSSQDPVTRAPVAPPPPQPRSIPIPAIPPSSNPRGELIFSSRVDRTFREGYERHRAAFERRREEREMKAREARGWGVSRWFQQGVWRRGKGKEAQAQASAGVEVEKGEKEKGTVDAKETEHEKGIIMKQRERRRSRERARESRVR
ncbi:hypothetical protein H0H87_003871 [Tephrocybe sp. NHM501043]|nr:hypothetical protein H0H87_003871 [Tephrocybe sp. NHM501043]